MLKKHRCFTSGRQPRISYIGECQASAGWCLVKSYRQPHIESTPARKPRSARSLRPPRGPPQPMKTVVVGLGRGADTNDVWNDMHTTIAMSRRGLEIIGERTLTETTQTTQGNTHATTTMCGV